MGDINLKIHQLVLEAIQWKEKAEALELQLESARNLFDAHSKISDLMGSMNWEDEVANWLDANK